MSPRTPLLLIASLAAPLAAVDYADGDFGNQPLAIGAGPRALGMGGAFSAVADDATACTWNPAGLTQLERPELAASLGWYHAAAEPTAGEHSTHQFLRPDHVSAVLPFFAWGLQQTVGLAWQRQYDYTRHLTIDQAFRDATPDIDFTKHSSLRMEQTGSLSTLGLSYAIEPRPGLSFGITVNQWADRWTRASHYRRESLDTTTVTLTIFDYPAHPTDVLAESTSVTTYAITHDTRVTSGTSLVLGTWWQATPALTLALVLKPGYHLDLETDTRIHEVDSIDGTLVTEADTSTSTSMTLHHPPSLTVGGAWRHADAHTLSCDATITRWSQYYIEDENGRRNPVNFFIAPDANRDLWSLRLGYEYVAILPRVVLVPRVGALLEFLPAATVAPSNGDDADQVEPTSDRWLGVTAGLSACFRQVTWDLGAQVRHGSRVGAGQFANPASTVDMTITTLRLGVTWQF